MLANYLEEAANIVATLFAVVFLTESVRGMITGPGDPARRSFAYLTMAVMAVQVVGNVDVNSAIDRISQVPDLGKLLLDSAGLVLAWALQRWVLHWTYPAAEARARARRLGWFLLAALGLLATFFFAAPIEHSTTSSGFYQAHAGSPWIWCYNAVFTVSFGLTQVDLARMSLRYLALADSAYLRLSLGLLAAGGVFGVIVVLNKATLVALIATGHAGWWPDLVITRVSQAGAFYCIGFGATCGTWVPSVTRWFRLVMLYRRIFPLWRAMRRSFPDIALEDQPAPGRLLLHADAYRTDRLRYRLVRLATEINDGRLRLRPYLDAPSSDDPTAEGRRIAAALSAHRAGDPPRRVDRTEPMAGKGDLPAEIAWLARVSARGRW